MVGSLLLWKPSSRGVCLSGGRGKYRRFAVVIISDNYPRSLSEELQTHKSLVLVTEIPLL